MNDNKLIRFDFDINPSIYPRQPDGWFARHFAKEIERWMEEQECLGFFEVEERLENGAL